MARSLLRKTAYAIGAVVAVVVLIGAVGFVYLSWPEWRLQAVVREETRTHDRPLNPQTGDENIIEADAIRALAPVRFSHGGSDDVLSFVSMPSFHAWRAVSIVLSPGTALAQGKIVGVQRRGFGSPLHFSKVATFAAPRAAFVQTAAKLHQLTDNWPGSGADLCYDGTPVAFEWIGRGRVTSGSGTVECDKHYAAVRAVVFAFLRRYGPDPEPAQPFTEATWRP